MNAVQVPVKILEYVVDLTMDSSVHACQDLMAHNAKMVCYDLLSARVMYIS